jgi:hypothetical protein
MKDSGERDGWSRRGFEGRCKIKVKSIKRKMGCEMLEGSGVKKVQLLRTLNCAPACRSKSADVADPHLHLAPIASSGSTTDAPTL